jgi:outer membrane protein OmpA-like peptidoglycan-associated protein
MARSIRRVVFAWLTNLAIACTGGGRPMYPSRMHRIVSTSSSMELLDAVAFAGNTTELAPPSYRTLDHVAYTLIANPSIHVIEVRCHGDSLPHAPQRAGLAQQRAEVVAAYLVAHGVAASRLTTRGVSDGADRSSPGDARIQQVEFLILARDE